MGKIGQRGFTLLEVLVAMGILMMIVLMMSTLFHSSTIAWDNGLRQAEMSIQARAAMSLMQQDLAQAVVSTNDVVGSSDTGMQCDISDNATGFSFWTLGEPDEQTGIRTLKRVEYWFAGSQLMREQSESLENNRAGEYAIYVKGVPAPLLDSISQFSISTPQGRSYTTNLPQWVEIEMTLEATSAGAAGIRVWSNGRDKTFDTADDKEERLRTWRD